jgi:hypothetical protein
MSKQVKNPEADAYYPATKSTYLNPEVRPLLFLDRSHKLN